MKHLIMGACILLGAGAFTSSIAQTMTFAPNVVVAHRGAFKTQHHPENSVAALREAIRLGCTGSEFDVHMTADDSLVVNHDPEFHGLPIEQSTYAQLVAFTLSNGEKIPTLREYLLAGMQRNTQTRLVLELKPSKMGRARADRIADQAVGLVKELQAAAYIVYISFDYNMLLRILQADPRAQTQYLEGDRSPAVVRKDGITGIDYHYSVFQKKPEWIAEAKQLGLALNAWTVNDVTLMTWLLDNGFDFITTNEPERLLQLLQERRQQKG
ncbi:MAG: hypothetical protein MUF29_06105 [Chitinophagaceae bacterium]|jgi:glycerophosphoryl diester phosphodiesterase|nr:hypothetical protein [Chitinophagaceae bacterium]